MKRQTLPKKDTENETNGVSNGSSGYLNGHGTANGKASEEIQISSPGLWSEFFNKTLVPFLLITLTPNVVILLWFTAAKCDGSFLVLIQHLAETGFLTGMMQIWGSVRIGSWLTTSVLLGYAVWALILMILLPGPRAEGPVTPKGNVPVYVDNGFACYLVTVVGFAILTAVLKSLGYTPTLVYDHFDEFLGTLTVFSLIFCVFLYLKGLYYPSTTDCGSSGNFIFDYYWGTELYPRICGIDLKVFTNCRFGMTVWPLLVLIFAIKSYELHGFVDSMWVSAILQMTYFTKFFWWEAGYMSTIDIMLDRAGFYICWGCLVFIPGLYASVSMYLVNHPVHLGLIWSAVILVVGVTGILVNYIADYQKQLVRRSNGECTIWGKKPEIIRAKYQLENGDTRESILLLSGWWGVARHFHYIPELTLAFAWSVPALFENLMPYCYFITLSVILIHRTLRDDEKCIKKYQDYWVEYCARVPYRMVPYVF